MFIHWGIYSMLGKGEWLALGGLDWTGEEGWFRKPDWAVLEEGVTRFELHPVYILISFYVSPSYEHNLFANSQKVVLLPVDINISLPFKEKTPIYQKKK